MTIETKQPEQICPIFTAAILMGNAMRPKNESRILPTAGLPQPITPPEQEAVPCARQLCQWWQPIMDADGKVLGGNCTVPMLTKQVFEGVNVLSRLINTNAPPAIKSKH